MGVTHGSKKRAGIAVIGLLYVLYLLAAAAPARSAPPELLWRVPGVGADQNSELAGKLNNPVAAAASPADGHVFVLDANNARVDEFTSWGEFVKALGWGVRDGSDELQSCTSGTGCFAGKPGAGPGQLDGPKGIAVDQAGDLWVSEFAYEETGHQDLRVQKFSAFGQFLLMIGRDVDKTTGGNICTAASGDKCGNGLPGTGEREFPSVAARASGDTIDADAAGTIFVGTGDRIQSIHSDGSFSGEVQLQGKLSGQLIDDLAVDSAGGFYLSLADLAGVHRIDSTGTEIAQLPVARPGSVAIDVAGNVYVVSQAGAVDNSLVDAEVLEFRPDGSCAICAGARFMTPPKDPAAHYPAELWGLATNVLGPGPAIKGDIYITAGTPFEPDPNLRRSTVAAYGPNPRFESPPSVPPEVGAEFTTDAGTTTATVQAEINPHFIPQTNYFVEYGTEACANDACATTQTSTLDAERSSFAPTSPVELSSLQPDTTYHYRFVAANGSGTAVGEERTFTTRSPSAAVLPDGRAYEMVSPPNKNNGEVGNPATLAAQLAPIQVAPSGEAITYDSLTAFGASPQSAPGGSQYLSRRTAQGWTTENVTPPDQNGYLSPPVQAFSEDLAFAAIGVSQPPLVSGAPEGVENLYLRDSASGTIHLLTLSAPTFIKEYCLTFEGASADFSRIFFIAQGSLTPEAPVGEGFNLYEWSAAEGLRVVSVLPNGSVAPPTSESAFGARAVFSGCGLGFNVTKNAISDDGSRAYWTREVNETSKVLYVRLNGSETIQVDKAESGGGPSGNGQFRAASADGSIAFFTAPGKLRAGAGAGALYRFDLEAEAGSRLSAITPGPGDANVKGVLGASEDGRRIYFIAGSSFAPGAEAGEANLYLWEEGVGLRYITTLADADASDWQDKPAVQTARTTPDGSSLAFLSTVPLTGFDNTDQSSGEPDAEAFIFDAETNQISCASCNPSGARPIGPASLPVWNRPFQQPRYLSDDGRRLFFASADALDLHDVNRRQDVYEFERVGAGDCTPQLPSYRAAEGGCIGLISPGSQNAPATLVDASGDGRDVFFGTPQSLVSQDVDENYDIYDARVGGGFPPTTPPQPPCSGDSCHPATTHPATPSPGSAGYLGPGNSHPANHRHRRKRHKHHHKAHKNRHHKAGRSSR